tara:strand:- start:477 stop:821 length:345 start_codon:yes stop_codon:yes gene_type:complete
MSTNTVDRPSVGETNGLVNGIAYHDERHSQSGGIKTVCWTVSGLEITRLRLLSDAGYPAWDVSYCHGILKGEHVNVRLPFSQLPKRNTKAWLYNEAKATGCFIKGLFSSFSTLT